MGWLALGVVVVSGIGLVFLWVKAVKMDMKADEESINRWPK